MKGGVRRTDKIGILVVAFGTSVPEAQAHFNNRRQGQGNVSRRGSPLGLYFQDHPDRLAGRGSCWILRPWPGQDDDDGFTRVAVQSLHTIPGKEYEYLAAISHAFEGLPKGFRKSTWVLPCWQARKMWKRRPRP
jgi:sirohydrochlorin cobaltochelatase